MKAIELMNLEHENITRMIKVVRKYCFKLLRNETIDYSDMDLIINFIINYADKYHHKKEEDILFSKMVKYLGSTAEKVVNNGMLVEHDLGRLYIKDLIIALEKLKTGDDEAKLDVIANAISYTHLLERHIDKEDRVIYKYAERELEEEILETLNKECLEFENANIEIKDKSLSILEELERKYY